MSPAFYFAGRLVDRAEGCKIYRIDKNKLNPIDTSQVALQPESIVGYYRYNIDNVRLTRYIAPRAPRSLDNNPVQRLLNRRLAKITPADWRTDPYIVCLLLGLAQFQWYKYYRPEQDIFLVRCRLIQC